MSGSITSRSASMLFELHLVEEGLRFIKETDGDVIKFKLPFEGGYTYIITFRNSRGVLATMQAAIENKIRDNSQRTVAAMYLSTINFTLAMGCFQLDLRDGEILYWAGIPLQDMGIRDSRELLKAWFKLFRASFNGYYDNIKVIIRGGSLQEALRA